MAFDFSTIGGELGKLLGSNPTDLAAELAKLKPENVAANFAEVTSRVAPPPAGPTAVNMASVSATRSAPAAVAKSDIASHIDAFNAKAKYIADFGEDAANATRKAAAIRDALPIGNSALDAAEIVEHHAKETVKQFAAVEEKLTSALATGKLTETETTAATAALNRVRELKTAATPHLTEAERFAQHYSEAVPKAIPGAAKSGTVGKVAETVAGATPAAAAGSTIYKDVAKKITLGQAWEQSGGKLFSNFGTEGKELAWKELGMGKKFVARIGGNLSNAGIGGKLKLAGGGLTTAYFGSGLVMDLGRLTGFVPLEKSATGEDVPLEFSKVAIDGAGTAAGVALALWGGRNAAMGIR